jgi:hypothetical protein
MRVAVDNGLAPRKRGRQSLLTTDGGARHVHHPDSNLLDLDDPALGQNLTKLRLVHVPPHGFDRGELLQLLEHPERHEVAGVQDQVGLPQPTEALRRQSTHPARHVGVGDDRDERQPAAPFTNAPSR